MALRRADGRVQLFDGETWRAFTTEDGLPSNHTFNITIDSAGDVWVGTYQGVAKYDGRRWTVPYSQSNGTIASNHVIEVDFDAAGGTWIAHHDAGVSHLTAGSSEWINFTEADGLGSNVTRDLLIQPATEDAPESIWIATQEGGVSRFQSGEWTIYGTADGLPDNIVYGLGQDQYGRVWAATESGVAYWQNERWTAYHTLGAKSVAFGIPCEDCRYDTDHVWTGTNANGATHSRLPYTEPGIDVREVCFVIGEESLCETPVEIDGRLVAECPQTLSPGQEVRLAITVIPRAPHQLRADRGDFLANLAETEEARYGTWTLMPAEGTVDSGEPFTFTSFDDPFSAPNVSEETSVTLSWRTWMHTRYTGPIVDLRFNVAPS